MTRKPAAFDLDEVRYEAEDLYPAEDSAPAAPIPPRPRRRWLALLFSAVGGLILLAVGFAVDALVRNLFERTLRRQANRLAAMPSPSRDDLCAIVAADIPSGDEV